MVLSTPGEVTQTHGHTQTSVSEVGVKLLVVEVQCVGILPGFVYN